MENRNTLLFEKETYMIIGAAMEVHRTLGSGFLEPVYQEALSVEFEKQTIPFVSQPGLEVAYKGKILRKKYRPDFVAFSRIIIELKAQNRLWPLDETQLTNYLKATQFQIGLLINFGGKSLEWKRKIMTKNEKIASA